jgi:gliding motility-associated-like protein
VNFKTSIYNRWGVLVWTGNNSTPDWDGFANRGSLIDNNIIPAGTYYYVIELNDPDYKEALVGFLYLTK